jgi:hypothetical protein
MKKHAKVFYLIIIGFFSYILVNLLANQTTAKLKTRPLSFKANSSGESFDSHQFRFKPTVRLAFALLVHDESTISGLYELMDVIYSVRHSYFIHVDSKVNDKIFTNLCLKLQRYRNIFVSMERYDCSWGSMDIVRAELALLRMAVNVQPWKFWIVLCGSSYPLHSLRYIEYKFEYLDPSSNLVFHEKGIYKICDFNLQYMDYDPCGKTLARCIDPKCSKMTNTPLNSVVYKGPQWVVLSYEFSLYVCNQPIVDDWILFFQAKSFAADEMFFQSVLMNSPFRNTARLIQPPDDSSFHSIHSINHMYTNWENCKTHPLHRPKGWSPCYLGTRDYDSIDKSFLFIRKIKPGDPLKAIINRDSQISRI